MDDIEHTNRQFHNSSNPMDRTQQKRRTTPRQNTSPSSETQFTPTSTDQLASLDLHQSSPTNKNNNVVDLAFTPNSSTTSKPGAGNSNSLPGHQSGRSKQNNPRLIDQQGLNLSDSLNSSGGGGGGDHGLNDSPLSNLSRKKNLSTSDLDPFERKKQAALSKVEAKLEKAQRLHLKAQQSVEQEISDFLRVTTVPNTSNEASSSRTTNASFDKRIKTLQDTKKELEKKINNYQTDISRIQAGEIPHTYSSSKDILSTIKGTAAKVAGGSLKHRSNTNNDQTVTISSTNPSEHVASSHHQPESDSHHSHHHHHTTTTTTVPTTITTPTTAATPSASGIGNQNNQNLLPQNQFEPAHSSVSSSTSNEIGNSQFYLDSNHEYIYDGERSNRKHEANALPADGTILHDNEKSPSIKRRPTEDSTMESNDRISDHSVDDRSTSKRQTSATPTEYQQLNTKIELMQKIIDRYELKFNDMQKHLEILIMNNETERELNERLNNELTDLTDLHRMEMAAMKNDLKNLEDRLLYKFNDYWNELLEKLDKLDTRTAKVEQTQTHAHETEENTHRIISKLVNIILTVFAIILLLLSTIKNLVQSRVHAMTLLILALVWITFHYLPPNYFHTSFLKNFPNMFKRTS